MDQVHMRPMNDTLRNRITKRHHLRHPGAVVIQADFPGYPAKPQKLMNPLVIGRVLGAEEEVEPRPHNNIEGDLNQRNLYII